MSSPKKRKNGPALFKIEGSLSVYEVGSLRDELLECLTNNDELELDLNDVSDCDTAGIQLLFSALKTTKDMGKKIRVQAISEDLKETATRMGIDLDNFISPEKGV